MWNYHDFKDLIVYKKAYQQAMQIFEITKNYPKEEKYSLTDQVRRSTRSVCANLAESFRKRMYINHFLLKLTDCLGENSKTLVWIDFSNRCKYIDEITYRSFVELNEEIGKLLSYIYNNPDKFGAISKS